MHKLSRAMRPMILTVAFLLGSLLAWSSAQAQSVKILRSGTTRVITSGASDIATANDYGGSIAWKSASASSKTETLPPCSLSNNGVSISVADEQNTAATFNINITASSGTVAGVASAIISTNRGGVIANCDGANTNWNVVAQSTPGVGGGGTGTVGVGTGPQIAQYPGGTGTAVAGATVSGDATLAAGGALTLANTTVAAGSYTSANIIVDSKGRVTSAANGSGGGLSGMTTGQVPIAASASTVTSSFPLSGTSGATQIASATSATKTAGHQAVYDANGNLIDGGAPGSGGTVTSVATGTGLTGGTITGSGTISVAANGITNALAAQMPLYTIKGNASAGTSNAQDLSVPTCPDSSGNHLNWVNGVGITCGTTSSGGGGSTPAFFPVTGGAFGGTSTAYTATATGFTLTAGLGVCGTFVTASGASPTLAVNALAAKSLTFNTPQGSAAVGPGAFTNPTSTCAVYDGTEFVIQSAPFAGAPITATHTVTVGEWGVCQPVVITTAGQTITLPLSSTLASGGCLDVQTINVTATLAPTAASGDAIDNGAVGGGAANASITLPADFRGIVNYSGTPGLTAFSVPLGPIQYFPLSWGVGVDLSLNTGGIDFGRFASPRIVYGVKCKNNTLSGSSQSMTFKYQTDAGGTMAAGTTISSAPFDMTANLGVEQTITLTSTPLIVPAAYSVGATVTGSSTTGSGRCQYTYR